MGVLSPILRSAEGGRVGFYCPGCGSAHVIPVAEGPALGKPTGAWAWDGSVDAPTFQPSILVSYTGSDAGVEDAPPAVCHSFVTAGKIQFLSDSTHALAGQTVPIPPWPADYGGME